MNTYAVGVAWEKHRVMVQARNSTEAKRIYCRMTGRKYSDYLCGASILDARKVTYHAHT